MKPVRTVVLDDDAVQALIDVAHRKHRRAIAAMDLTTPTAGSAPPRLVVPTAVRVEAGWSRRSRGAAVANRFRVDDATLSPITADAAAEIRVALDLSVADAHLAAVLQAGQGPFAVLTSDVDDVRRIVAHLDVVVTIVAL